MSDTQPGPTNLRTIGLIGFGEAARAFVSGWSQAGITLELSGFDIKTVTAGPFSDEKRAQMSEAGVRACQTPGEAIAGAGIVFSLVTAEQAFAAAQSVANALAPDALFFDCNSCAPQTKQRSAAVIEEAGGRYVDAAVMAPVHPALHRTPILLSGDHTALAFELTKQLDMAAKPVDGGVGTASAMKLVRSIVMKGLEALALECLLAGRALGVEDTVLDSLEATYPEFDWHGRMGAMLERAMTHGLRRAAEMREAARMVDELGLPGRMAAATADWEQAVGDLALTARPEPSRPDVRSAHLDQLLAALNARQ